MQPAVQWKNVSVHDISRKIDQVSDWQRAAALGDCLQAGDLCWKGRFGPESLAVSLTEFVDANECSVAILLEDAPGSWRLAHRPGQEHDPAFGDAVARKVAALPAGEKYAIDGPEGPSSLRRELARVGFELGDNAYANLWKPLSDADLVDVPDVRGVKAGQDADDRVAVQRAAFDTSTFTVVRWESMAASPLYRSELDLLARTTSEEPVAALTAWFMGEGQCAMIEPMGTHREFRRQGHGVRVLRAASAALAPLGSSGYPCAHPNRTLGRWRCSVPRDIARLGLFERWFALGNALPEP